MQDTATRAQAWAQSDAPLIWLLGKTQSGKTSIVAEIAGQARDQIGQGYAPVTREARIYAFPETAPALRFLDTRGLGDVERYDPRPDLEQAGQHSHLVIAAVRVDDLALDEILAALREARRAHPDWPVLVAQTTLHRGYGRHDRHRLPYPFAGTADDARIPGLPDELRRVMLAQRALFTDLPGRSSPRFVPLDFTQPDQLLPPSDYGAGLLWDVLEETLPEVVARLRAARAESPQQRIRARVILPWALAAAAANAVPVPMLGGLGSASLQAAMINQIARQLGVATGLDQWREFAAALGAGFALGFGGRWLAQQGLKLGLGWGTALVASWTFAITWGLGEAALYYFGEKAAGREPDRRELAERYRLALREARDLYRQRRGDGT